MIPTIALASMLVVQTITGPCYQISQSWPMNHRDPSIYDAIYLLNVDGPTGTVYPYEIDHIELEDDPSLDVYACPMRPLN